MRIGRAVLLLSSIAAAMLLASGVALGASVEAAQTQETGTAEPPTLIGMWGGYGSKDGQFESISGVATDSTGNVYVADSEQQRVQKFDSSGIFITQWGELGTEDGEFYYPEGVATVSSNNVYVVDRYNDRVQKFDSDGTFIDKWGSLGVDNGEFYRPSDVATDSSDNVYVTDRSNQRIQKFGSDGTFVTKWEIRDSYGNLDTPNDVAVDSSGNVYASTWDTIYKFGADNGAPKVSTTTPARSKTGVKRDTDITVTFSEQMESSTLTGWPVPVKIVKASTGQEVYIDRVRCDNPCRSMTIDTSSNLAKNTEYKATINTKAKDLSGKALTKKYTWTFTTGRR